LLNVLWLYVDESVRFIAFTEKILLLSADIR